MCGILRLHLKHATSQSNYINKFSHGLVFNFEKFNLDEEGIDIAFLPDWFLIGSEGQTLVREHIKPKQIIAVHVSPANGEKVAAQIRQAFPGAIAFTTMLEKKQF